MAFYLVYQAADPRRSPGASTEFVPGQGERVVAQPNYVPYNVVTVVEADDARDAVQQCVSATGMLGQYVAVECEPVSLDIKPQRLLPKLGSTGGDE